LPQPFGIFYRLVWVSSTPGAQWYVLQKPSKTIYLNSISGIGKKDILEEHSIMQLMDLPVGENLREPSMKTQQRIEITLKAEDHCFALFVYEISNKYETLDVLGDPERFQRELKL
jgi:hypothetical protein